MTSEDLAPVSYLRQILTFDASTGNLTWNAREGNSPTIAKWNSRFSGKRVSTVQHGYLILRIKKKMYKAHRVAWALHFGEWPVDTIDHINGIKCDNRIVNLREASMCEQSKNRKVQKNSKSGVPGVFAQKNGKWIARIKSNKVWYHLGTFQDFSGAVEARKIAEKKFRFHPNHGRM